MPHTLMDPEVVAGSRVRLFKINNDVRVIRPQPQAAECP